VKNIVVIPTYNEKENIGQIVPEIFRLMPEIFVLVVDDNSPDGTAKIVKSMQEQFPNLRLLLRQKKEGLGRAYICAFENILKENDIGKIVTMDADFSHNPEYLKTMIETNAGVTIGSRYMKNGQTEGWELWRRILSRGANLYCRLILRMPIFDYTSGFNAIDASFLRKIDFSQIDISGYAFLIELKYLLSKEGALLKEIPIKLTNRRGGESKIASHIVGEGFWAPWKIVFKKSKKKCPICSQANAVFFTKKKNYNLYKCQNCSLIFILPPPQNHLAIYSEDYFKGAENGFGYVDYDNDKDAMASCLNDYLDKIESFTDGQRGRLLDIGAATGYFMELAQKRGWQTKGIEISEYAAQKAREKGLDVLTGIPEALDFGKDFDLITLWDVMEHLAEPRSTLSLINKALKPGGVLAINTPDAKSLVAKILGKRWHLIVPPEHVFLYNKKNLSYLLSQIGFEIIFAGQIGKKFTLRYAVQIFANKQNPILKKIAKFLRDNPLGKLVIPFSLGDNFFLLARKK
jgi:dolichol-phosphate mannosyltransferase